ncbi:MAG: glycine--tRNA ligase [Bacteroidales bacterium]|jgi:glycyl-tRNA synthetase|nr:glycine--tRNA ligase [Bacteroidales bacterium]MDI9591475.1 glycine--tRNA ligase [Bacteroidota bacterium]OQC38680.1 MAG: Glycine--tRNA ligase [Bacteroidetes bacterium ADurb.Bin041]HNV50442.1 glycine--tRNA ligase [Bacteroidales bacterium]HNY58849.1 glycine--tRNA ligase [Bacteroidales bacterium]
MTNNEDKLKKIISHSKEYGFVFPSSEIYDGLSAVYDYGQYGVELKNNIKDYWWKSIVQFHENIVGLDSSIFMHPTIWKASGHVDAFNDPMIDNKDSKKRYRADVLVEDHILKIESKIEKEIEKAAKRFGDSFDKEQFVTTNPRVTGYLEQIAEIRKKLAAAMDNDDLSDLRRLIEELEIVCPISGSRNWTDVRQFNLMFSTSIGSLSEGANTIYLRPETAQGIFVNFLNVLKSGRMKVPFGIAQIGKAFRNEIVARQFIFRMREFEQMEMQYFVRPGTELDWFKYWKDQRLKWHLGMGIPEEYYRFHEHDKLAHYANAAFDIEFNFPMGFKELEGIHSRTDFDLEAHQQYSGKKIQYFDPELQENYVPYVVETSIGLDRTFLAVLSYGYHEETLDDGSERVVMRIPPFLAPIKAAVLPLVKKDGMPEKAREIFDWLKMDYMIQYDDKDAIGRRYRRQDAIGTPYCITIDSETLENDTVTIRERDSMKQDRIPINKISTIINERLTLKS